MQSSKQENAQYCTPDQRLNLSLKTDNSQSPAFDLHYGPSNSEEIPAPTTMSCLYLFIKVRYSIKLETEWV